VRGKAAICALQFQKTAARLEKKQRGRVQRRRKDDLGVEFKERNMNGARQEAGKRRKIKRLNELWF
jgi:hypothetical protein